MLVNILHMFGLMKTELETFATAAAESLCTVQ